MNTKSLSLAALSKGMPSVIGTRGRQRLMILIYHRVLPEPDFMRPSEPDVAQFSWQMELLSRYFNPIGLREATQRLQDQTLPQRAVCVTFDDGYADNAELALPILEKNHIPATVFVATGFLNGGRMWNDTVIESIRNMRFNMLDLTKFGLGSYKIDSANERRLAAMRLLIDIKHLNIDSRQEITDYVAALVADLPQDLMMNDQQVRELHQRGVEVGGHTHTHPILASQSGSEARKEIAFGKQRLESIVDAPVSSFAYPNGRPGHDFLPLHRDMIAEIGFERALTTVKGAAHPGSDFYMLPRFTPWDKAPARFMVRLLLNSRNIV